jgi:hypothetical protein
MGSNETISIKGRNDTLEKSIDTNISSSGFVETNWTGVIVIISWDGDNTL